MNNLMLHLQRAAPAVMRERGRSQNRKSRRRTRLVVVVRNLGARREEGEEEEEARNRLRNMLKVCSRWMRLAG